MISVDKPVFFRIINEHYNFCDKKPPSADNLSKWFDLLKDFDINDVKSAIHNHEKYSRYTLRPADVVKSLCGENQEGKPIEERARRCQMVVNDTPCPLLATIICSGHPDYCSEHYAFRNRPAEALTYSEKMAEHRPVKRLYTSAEILIARRMSMPEIKSDPEFGDPMWDYLEAHPLEETHPAWAESGRIGGMGAALKRIMKTLRGLQL